MDHGSSKRTLADARRTEDADRWRVIPNEEVAKTADE
jgi:hypothetical protein